MSQAIWKFAEEVLATQQQYECMHVYATDATIEAYNYKLKMFGVAAKVHIASYVFTMWS